jgi:hypothetical protein
MVKNAVFPGGSSLSARTYSSLTDVQKFITLRPFILLGSVNNRWKDEKLLYTVSVEIQVILWLHGHQNLKFVNVAQLS